MKDLTLAAVLVIATCFALESPAAEIDSVTTRGVPLEDSAQLVNDIINRRLRDGIANGNVSADDVERTDPEQFCDEGRLFAELRKAVFQTWAPGWGLRGYDLDLRRLLQATSYSLALQDSIYRDIDYLEGFSLKVKELSDVIRIRGHLVGLDKLGHFFAEGWEYFERTRYEDQTLENALRWGIELDQGKFGYATTGIHSFADLTANFNGWLFWNRVLDDQDVGAAGLVDNGISGSYVDCELLIIDSLKHWKPVRAWRQQQSFDISNYVDAAWDEGNNCNGYQNPLIEEKVDQRVDEASPGFSCPVSPRDCRSARVKYAGLAKYLLHPGCLTVDPG